MVNYCCVYGCTRNSKTSKHLFYYSLPTKDSSRLALWLRTIDREDLMDHDLKKLSYKRICSRHFAPSSIKNRHLCADAVPTLFLPNNDVDEEKEEEVEHPVHDDIVCNSCNKHILGFRYKCITCPDYDLCSKCEMFEAHSEHYLLRIPKPVNFKVADTLIKKWQQLVLEDSTCNSSDDDMPIKNYVKQSDSGYDLSEDVKTKIQNEVKRILNIKHAEPKKRKKDIKKKVINIKKKKSSITESCTESMDDLQAPEVAFADVNNIKSGQLMDVKYEIPAVVNRMMEVTDQPMIDLTLTDVDFILPSLT